MAHLVSELRDRVVALSRAGLATVKKEQLAALDLELTLETVLGL